MAETDVRQGSSTKIVLEDRLDFWIESFLYDRDSQNMTPGTMNYYRVKLKKFAQYCEGQQFTGISQISANDLRRFIAWLKEEGHNDGGRASFYKVVKTFLRWYDLEAEPEGWRNPIRKVKAPKVALEPLKAISVSQIESLLATCDRSYLGCRDKAIFYALFDTAARAQEFLNFDIEDINFITGSVLIRKGKGRKPRMVRVGSKTRRAIRAYLRFRKDDLSALWVTDDLTKRLEYFGIRSMIVRRSGLAEIPSLGLHAFRRGSALEMWRNNVDIYAISKYLGHSSVEVTKRYLALDDTDIQKAHQMGGPVDHSKL